MITDNNDKRMYGVWVPGQGWLKGKDVFSDYSLQKAQQVARLIGRNSVVRFIDKSIVDLEQSYLDHETNQEGKSLWHIFKNYLQRKTNK